jgi:N-acetylglucosamine-6-phosphate deacetylase
MQISAVHAARILTPLEEIRDAVVVVEDGRITAVGHRDELQLPSGATEYAAPGMTLVPGFVDLHIHGAGGHDVMEATPEAMAAVATAAARAGTTSLVATTVTAPLDATCRSLEGMADFIAGVDNQPPNPQPRAEFLGIHLEGPFISRARRGVHPLESIAAPSIETLDRLLEAARGTTRILTLAPERPGALEVIEHAVAKNLLVALGHTDATYEEARAAIAAGARHAVHVFNAMRPFSHRETGVLGAVLTDPSVTVEVIADGVHVDDAALRLLLAVKGAARVLLVSDGTAATGMPDGSYHLGTLDVVVKDGVCRNREGRLAGSTLTLDRALRRMVALGVPLLEAVQMATLHPARRLGIAGRKGVIAAGADADLVLLTDSLQVAGVMVRGAGLS